MVDNSINALRQAAQVDSEALHRPDLTRISAVITGSEPDDFIHAVTRVCGLSWESGRERPADWLELHDDRSWVELGKFGNRQRFLQAALAAVIVDSGAVPPFASVTLAARCLSAVADLTDGVVTIGPQGLRFVLRLCPTPFVLPDHLVAEIHPEDFREFCEGLAASVSRSPLRTGSGAELIIEAPVGIPS